MATKLYHIGSAGHGVLCTSRRTGFIKRYAIKMTELARKPEAERCKRCNVILKNWEKNFQIDLSKIPPITKP